MLQIPLALRKIASTPDNGAAEAMRATGSQTTCKPSHVGDWVEVRSREEILATLDERGRLDGMPFMPEMLRYCGQMFQVYKRAHKSCDTISGAYPSRSVPDSVHLDLRCSGAAHGGCQAGCLLYWKTAWLRPVEAPEKPRQAEPRSAAASLWSAERTAFSEDALHRATTLHSQDRTETRYVCQATQLFDYTKPLPWWDARQYVEDYTSGNVSLGRFLAGTAYATFVVVTQARRRTLGKPGRWLFDRLQRLWGGRPYPRFTGAIPVGQSTPRVDFDLQPGDIVRVKPLEAIRATLDTSGANRHMNFDSELVPYCGRMFRVRTRIERFVCERTGELKKMKTPAVILEGVYCQSCYSKHRLFCPRSIYSWWREIWLEPVTGQSAALPSSELDQQYRAKQSADEARCPE